MTTIIKNTRSLKLLAKGFSAPNFRKILNDEENYFSTSNLRNHIEYSENFTLKDILSSVYRSISKDYRCEYYYKNILLNKLLLGKHSLNTATALSEFKINNSKADFVLINGKAVVYEIKTDFDNLEKLRKQLIDYSMFASYVNVVTSNKFIDTILETYHDLPVGVIELTKQNTLRTIKAPIEWRNNLSHSTMMKTLRKAEFLKIYEEQYGKSPDVPNTLLFSSCLRAFEDIDVNTFQKLVSDKLKLRKLATPEMLTSDTIPKSLKYVCHSLDLGEPEYKKLLTKLNA